MALIVQSYPPVVGANSYASVQAFKAWMDGKLKVYAGKSDEQLAAALIDATEYVDNRFSYIGYRFDKAQDTEWPRQNAWDDRGDKVDGVHPHVVRATFEYAWRVLNGVELNPDLVRDETGQAVQSKSSAVGPVSESVTYAPGAFARPPEYPAADAWLRKRGLVCTPAVSGFSVQNTGRA